MRYEPGRGDAPGRDGDEEHVADGGTAAAGLVGEQRDEAAGHRLDDLLG